jgi:hypothetical protein
MDDAISLFAGLVREIGGVGDFFKGSVAPQLGGRLFGSQLLGGQLLLCASFESIVWLQLQNGTTHCRRPSFPFQHCIDRTGVLHFSGLKVRVGVAGRAHVEVGVWSLVTWTLNCRAPPCANEREGRESKEGQEPKKDTEPS